MLQSHVLFNPEDALALVNEMKAEKEYIKKHGVPIKKIDKDGHVYA